MDRIKTPVSRVGNKSNLLGIIYALFPPDYNRFVDVFGGSGSVLLGKPRIDSFEVYNDFDGNLVNLFRVMKSRPMALIRELGFCTLNSRADFNAIRDFFKGKAPEPMSMMEDERTVTKMGDLSTVPDRLRSIISLMTPCHLADIWLLSR